MSETVISCSKTKEWTSPEGRVIPIYAVGLSDGRGGESFREIPIGTPVSDLQMEESFHGLKIKWNNKPGGTGGWGKKERSGNESFALSYAKDLVVAGKVDIKQILGTADKLYNWLESKKRASVPAAAPAPAQPAAAPVAKPQPTPPPPGPTDDLPF